MESNQKDPVYSAITSIVKVIKDNLKEQKIKPRKVSIKLDNLEINIFPLKYPIKLSANVNLDFSGSKKEDNKK